MKRVQLFACILVALGGTPAAATNSLPELEQVKLDLLSWLPGKYSSTPQIIMERQYGAPSDGEHADLFRVFARVDVPDVGSDVIFGELRSGGPDGTVVPGSQVLYILSIVPEVGAVSVRGKRVKNFVDFDPDNISAASLAALEIDAESGGDCDFRWRRHGQQLVGRLAETGDPTFDGTCTMTSRASAVTMTWDTEWVLTPWELWIHDNGYIGEAIDEAELFQGRRDGTFQRFYKQRDFVCQLDIKTEENAQRITGQVVVADRGSEISIDPPSPEASPLVISLMRGYWAVDGAPGMTERLRLTVKWSGAQQALGETWSDPLATEIATDTDVGDVVCMLPQQGTGEL